MYAEPWPSYRNFRPVWKRKRGIVRMSNKEKATKISWLTLAFMAFSTVWGFGNITNGFVYFNGPQVIFSWIFMFVLYFIPYALMVGELGSAFKNEGGGVSSWLHQTTNAKLAYYAGWTYWACHITYTLSGLPVYPKPSTDTALSSCPISTSGVGRETPRACNRWWTW